MPRLKPPPSQQMAQEDHTPPTEPIEIALPGDEPGETEVELAPAPEPEPAPAPVTEENPLQAALDAQKRAEEMQRAAQRERDEALRREQERAQELERERGGRQDAEYNSLLTAIAAEQAALDKAEADYAAYASAGDFATAAKAQRIMAISSARLDRLEDGKQAFEQRREQQPEPPKPPPQSAPLDFEGRIAKMPESAKSWLRKHPEFINDSTLNAKIGNAHNYLVNNKSIEAFSPAYFDALDDEFGFKAVPQPETAPQPQRRSMPVSAPVSRDVPTANGQRQTSTKITLTAEERAIAHTSFTAPDMTNAQKELLYAQNKRKLQNMRANGQYPQPERN
jgi:hypothetical protein